MSNRYLSSALRPGQSTADFEAKTGLTQCGVTSQTAREQTPPSPELKATNERSVNFNRQQAAAWAIAHAMDAPPRGVDSCTYFVSKALEAGGLPQDDTWNLGFSNIKRDGSVRYGTETAWVATELAQYLQDQPYIEVHPIGHMNAGNNDLPQARPGDVIAYVWHGDGLSTGIESLNRVEHLSEVVGHSKDNINYPTVAEWGNTEATRYNSRGWTWSNKTNNWLQAEEGQQNMFAYLIHIKADADYVHY